MRGRGLLWGFEFVSDRASRKPPAGDPNPTGTFTAMCRDAGLIVYPAGIAPFNNAAIVAPPFVISSDEVQELLRRLAAALLRMEDAIDAAAPATGSA